MREDTHTATEADAGTYASLSAADYRSDIPSASDLAEDAQWDRWETERRNMRTQAAHARGEYVPSVGMGAVTTTVAMVLAQHRLIVEATPVREGVMRVTSRAPLTAPEVVAVLGEGYEVREHDNSIWVRVSDETVARWDSPPF